jgi:plasmid stability protein
MSKMLQIRNVPDRLHRLAKARAAAAGLSLSDYLLAELRKTLELPTFEEVLAQLPRFQGGLRPSVAEILRDERKGR